MNYLIYWRDYEPNILDGRTDGWYSNSRTMAGVQPGERLWLVTAGRNIDHEDRAAAFLVAVWTADLVLPNPGDELYPEDEYRYMVTVTSQKWEFYGKPKPPIHVDPVLRPAGADKTISIGRFLQGPRPMPDHDPRLSGLRSAAGIS